MSKAQENPVDAATSAAPRPSPVKDRVALLSALRPETKAGTPLAAGMMLTPSVRLLHPLGDGGMASVWVALHTNLGVNVAVKLLNESMQTLPAVYQRFLAEGPSAARIRSPHVVQILDRGVTPSGTPFIVMELLDGETVQGRLDRDGMLSLDDVRSVLTQTARALSKAHASRLAHCDVKPENIFLIDNDPDVFVKLLDFGIAKHFGEKDDSGIIFGTPQYMAPEQMVADGHIGVHTDVWSLAVVTYQMLTAGVPFGGETLEEVAEAVDRGSFMPVSSLRHDIPVELDTWFDRAFAKDPAARFASMREMVSAFEVACRAHAFKRVPAMSVHEFTFNGDRAALLLPPLPSETPLPKSPSTAPPVSDSAPFEASLSSIPKRPQRWLLPTVAALAIVGLGSLFTVVRATEGSGVAHAEAASPEPIADGSAPAAAAPVKTAEREIPSPALTTQPTASAATTSKAAPKFRAAPKADPFRPRPDLPKYSAKKSAPAAEDETSLPPSSTDVYRDDSSASDSASVAAPTPAPEIQAPAASSENPPIL